MSVRRKKTRKPRPARRPKRKRRSFGRRLFGVTVKLGFAVLLVWLLVAAVYYAWALTYDLSAIREIPQRSTVYDRNGNFYSRLAGENRVTVPFDHVSNDFVNALISREDTRFYSHHGVDPIGIARAMVRNLTFRGVREGGSTITQQLAKNSFSLGGKNLQRKLIEAALAFRIETELTKEEILEAYMNRIYFGSGYWGIDTASRAYFGRPATKLTLAESALLAGLIKSPTNLSPFNNLEASVRERNIVLKRMRELNLIDGEQFDRAVNEKVRLAKKPAATVHADWAMETIQRELALVLTPEQTQIGGLNIYTTLDPQLQRAAERSVRRRLDQIESRPGYRHPAKQDSDRYLQSALIAIDNRSGGIRAIIGGRDYSDSKYHRAFDAKRPVGSTAKPFVYATAFAHGLKPSDRVSDGRLKPGELPANLGKYDPANSDGKYGGDIRVSEALSNSRNTATVRVGLRAGLPDVVETMRLAGLPPDLKPYPSICLGAFEATLRDLTSAYTAFPTGGIRLQPYLIEKVTDADGALLFQSTHGRIRYLDQKVAEQTTEILEDVVRRGTASSARALGLRKRAGGKTGTTDQFHDAWFVGFTKSLTCGVWVGFDQPRTIMRGGYGADLALPIWVDVMQSAGSSNYPD